MHSMRWCSCTHPLGSCVVASAVPTVTLPPAPVLSAVTRPGAACCASTSRVRAPAVPLAPGGKVTDTSTPPPASGSTVTVGAGSLRASRLPRQSRMAVVRLPASAALAEVPLSGSTTVRLAAALAMMRSASGPLRRQGGERQARWLWGWLCQGYAGTAGAAQQGTAWQHMHSMRWCSSWAWPCQPGACTCTT